LLFFTTGVTAILESRDNNRKLKTVNDDLAQAQTQSILREEQLKDTVAELGTKTTVIERAPFGVIMAVVGPSGLRFTYVNPHFCVQSGYAAKELLGAPLALILGPLSQAHALQALQKAIESTQTAELELVLHRRDGSPLWTRLLLFPTFDDQQRLQRYVLCVNDITEVRRAEEERQRLAGELHETMKLESLGLTIAGIAHDLNTPIGVAITASSHLEQMGTRFRDAAQQAAPTPAEVEHFTSRMARSTELIRNNLNKAAVLVRSFKQTTADASRTEWRTIALRPFLDSILLSVSPIMRRARCEVSITCPDALSIHTEPGSLGSALTNLLINATIHAFEGREDRRISLVVSSGPRGVRLSCIDNGVGMSEEAVSKVFTPFFTTKRKTGGSGLGLFSSRRTVEQILNGKLTMETIQGEGTTFHIDLPVKEATHER
jgi:PAS domain S-box-containing protein